jgi:signal transduction histidine kinase
MRVLAVFEPLRLCRPRAPLRIDVVDNGIGRCPRPIESAIYFCSMEAIQNVIKHAGDGARATIIFERDGKRAAFAIADDGIGMDVSAPGDGDGDGLVGMRDRVGAVGGELRITSSPAVGTTVRGSIPLENGTATTSNSA